MQDIERGMVDEVRRQLVAVDAVEARIEELTKSALAVSSTRRTY